MAGKGIGQDTGLSAIPVCHAILSAEVAVVSMACILVTGKATEYPPNG